MSPFGKIKYYFHLYSNIKNVSEYRRNRRYRDVRPLQFVTRPHPIHFTVAFAMYPVFKEIFCLDVYRINGLVKQLPQDAVVIDIGANCGFFDVLLLSKLPAARIFAFEPLSVNVNFINATIEKNVLMQRQVQVFTEAVTGNLNGQLELYMESSDVNTEVASVFADFDKLNTKKISVPCRALAQVIKDCDLPRIDLLKMDCEGSEYDIIYNTPINILQKIKRIAAEIHQLDTEKRNLKSMVAFLQQAGYVTKYWLLYNSCFYLQASLPAGIGRS